MNWIRRFLETVQARPEPIPAPLWREVVSLMGFLNGMSVEDDTALRTMSAAFLEQKPMHGAGGFVMTDEIRIAIAVQACLPILQLGLESYAGWSGIVVYSSAFQVTRQEVDEFGVMHEWEEELAGESWEGGPVVLSWDDADRSEPGFNLVIHEFAHKLDLLCDAADGLPPPPEGYALEGWRRTIGGSYKAFCRSLDRGDPAPFDEYGAENLAEYFAVMTEAFFTDPRRLRRHDLPLYSALRAFYRQDPAVQPGRRYPS
jgi:Mlc titration factor MtfA (ptsG expression regulator)